MKYCKYCERDLDESQFSVRSGSTGKLNNKCKQCVVAYTQAHYQANKDVYVQRSLADRPNAQQRWRDFIATLNLKCAHCDEDHPAVMEFHHPDPSVKEDNPSNLRYSKQRFLREIENCICLCANCHRKVHWALRQAEQ